MNPDTCDARDGVERRSVLKGLGILGALATVGSVSATPGEPDENTDVGATTTPVIGDRKTRKRRRKAAYEQRKHAARHQLLDGPLEAVVTNGDEERFGAVAAFTKGVTSDALGVATPAAYDALLAMLAGDGPLDSAHLGGPRKLANPTAAHSFDVSGTDSQLTAMPPAPAFDSDETGAEMVELYWQSLLRDVAFADYATHPTALRAAAELDELTGYTGPKGLVDDPSLLFRGTLEDCDVGPHLSQFLYHPVPRGLGHTQEQRYTVPTGGPDYATGDADWLAVQRGFVPDRTGPVPTATRYLITGRDLATYVHADYVYQAYEDAALILLGLGVPLDANLPTSPVEGHFVDFGIADVLDAVTGVSRPALHAAWVQKWLVNRRLRPEAYGGRVHHHLTGNATYPLPTTLVESDALAAVFDAQGTYLLSQAYAEGSPMHPSYPAGHAVIAGACVTVLKAFFDEDAVLPSVDDADSPGYTTDTLTARGELHKLAENMSIGRNWAGIHYRSDAADGYRLGEAVALAYLVDRARAYDETYGFDGFSLTRFDDTPVTVTADGVY
ncbi:vanadium-dependent haloperoxidase [Haloarchaeobius sp. TZWWS8]|uniref:vanadium-dependent haloperoxidase n=1 Tax=Haloarchaeobius sp. TZWWS8 TaxID=3446121 RepID=UPI003EBD322B